MLGVALSQSRLLAARLQLLQRVLADCLQHPKSRVGVGLLVLPHQAFGDQRLYTVQRVDVCRVNAADRVRRVEGPATHEHAQAAKEMSLGLVQEVVAPGDGAAQSLLTGR